MRWLLAIAAVTICLHTQAQAQRFECPEPIKQVAANIKGEIDAQAQGLLKVAGAGVKGAVETSVVNLFEKYPNVDRITIVQNFQSTACQSIRDSNDSDQVKWQRIMDMAIAVDKFIR